MRIDSHHHFWNYSPEAYPWIGDDMRVLKRDFAPADLKPLLDEHGITGVVSVQARAEEAENDFLLKQAVAHDWILGVVGWLDLSAPDAPEKVARFAERPKGGTSGTTACARISTAASPPCTTSGWPTTS